MTLIDSWVDHEYMAAPNGVLGLKELAQKLAIMPRHKVAVINAPPESRLRLLTAASLNADQADAVVGFASRPVDLARLKPAYTAAHSGRLAWISYPKPGRRGSDLRRDWLIRALHQYGVEPAYEVSIDHAWSAMRLHPIKAGDPSHLPVAKERR